MPQLKAVMDATTFRRAGSKPGPTVATTKFYRVRFTSCTSLVSQQ